MSFGIIAMQYIIYKKKQADHFTIYCGTSAIFQKYLWKYFEDHLAILQKHLKLDWDDLEDMIMDEFVETAINLGEIIQERYTEYEVITSIIKVSGDFHIYGDHIVKQ